MGGSSPGAPGRQKAPPGGEQGMAGDGREREREKKNAVPAHSDCPIAPDQEGRKRGRAWMFAARYLRGRTLSRAPARRGCGYNEHPWVMGRLPTPYVPRPPFFCSTSKVAQDGCQQSAKGGKRTAASVWVRENPLPRSSAHSTAVVPCISGQERTGREKAWLSPGEGETLDRFSGGWGRLFSPPTLYSFALVASALARRECVRHTTRTPKATCLGRLFAATGNEFSAAWATRVTRWNPGCQQRRIQPCRPSTLR